MHQGRERERERSRGGVGQAAPSSIAGGILSLVFLSEFCIKQQDPAIRCIWVFCVTFSLSERIQLTFARGCHPSRFLSLLRMMLSAVGWPAAMAAVGVKVDLIERGGVWSRLRVECRPSRVAMAIICTRLCTQFGIDLQGIMPRMPFPVGKVLNMK